MDWMINNAGTNTDKAINNNHKDRLAQHKNLADENVQYTAQNSRLTLKGSVKTQAEKKRGRRLAKKIPQVQRVVNDLEVTPTPTSHSNS